MADDIKLNIETVGANQVDKLAKDTVKIEKSLERQLKLLQAMKKEQDQTFAAVRKNAQLTPKAALTLLSSGGAKASLRNAEITGQIKQFEAEMNQTMARVLNRFGRGLTDTVKAAEFQRALNLKKTGNFGVDTSLSGLKREQLVRQAKIAESELFITSQKGRFFKGQPELLKDIKLQQSALESLNKTIEDTTRKQKIATETKNLIAKSQNKDYQNAVRQSKVESLLGDGGAGLLKIQAGLAGNYLVLNSLFDLINFGKNFVVELDAAFRDLQAITNTTDTEMVGLKQTLIDTSQATKFTAVEVTKAATILGQAGFSTDQIESSIKGVTLLATATGTDLAESADVASSTISVFNLRAEEMDHVANVLTGSINLSKLTMDKLALGIQYAGNAAFQSGSTLEELVSVLGALANAGIKSGSTLGTGLRQIIVELQDPSKKFKENMDKLGLSMSDIDVKSQGLIGVFENLRDAGFNSSMAFKSFETRAASAYIAISNNIDVANRLYESIGFSNAAAIANERQMQSLSNTAKNLGSAFGTLVYSGAQPLVQALVVLTRGLTSVINGLNEIKPLSTGMITIFTSLGVSIAGLKIVNLVRGLYDANLALLTIRGTLLPFIGVTAAVTAGVLLLGGAFSSLSSAKDKVDAATAALNEAEGALAAQEGRIESVDEELNRLANRYNKLKTNNSALGAEVRMLQAKFGEFSSALASGTISSIDELIAAMQEVRQEFSKLSAEQAKFVQEQNKIKFLRIQDQYRTEGNSSYILDNIDTSGFIPRIKTSTLFDAEQFSRGNSAFLGNRNLDVQTATKKELDAAKEQTSKLLSNTLKYLSYLTNELSKTATDDSFSKAEINKAIDVIQKEKAKLFNDLALLDSLAVKDMNTKVKEIAATNVAANISATVNKFTRQLAQQKELIDAEKDPMKKDALGKELKKIQGYLDKYIASLIDEKSALFQSLFAEVGSKDAAAEFVGSVRGSVESLSTDYGSKVEEVEENTKNFLDNQEKFFDGVAEIQKAAYERLKSTVNNNLDAYDREIKNIDNIIAQSTDLRNGSLRGQYSDAEIAMLEDSKIPLQNKRRNQEIANLKSLLPGADATILSAQKYVDVAQAKYNQDPNKPDAIRDLTSAQKDLTSAQKDRYEIEKSLLLLQDEAAVMNGETILQHKALGDQISYVLTKYFEQKKLQSDLGLNIQQNIIDTLDNAESAFSTFIESSVTGTKSLKESFKDMAVSIIQDMLKMQAKQAATGILNFLVGSVTSMIGGSKGATIYSGPAGPIQMATGGFVRAATGMANLGRDSVHTLLKPGEYVLREQAVDQIGRANLDTINALGARTISQSVPATSAMPMKSEPSITNVYVVAPEEKPSLGKNDVIVTIAEDLLRGGTTKKLVKAIATGGM